MADNEVTIRLKVEGNAKVELEKATDAVEDFSRTTKKSLVSVGRAFEVFSGVLGAQVFLGAINKAGRAAKRLFNTFVTDGVQAAQVQEDAINQLNTALVASGKFTADTSKELQEYASQLQAATKFGDETILQTQALIQSLGQLDKEGLKQATKATLDLSAALGVDLNTAALLVGKAAAGEISTFSRYGLIIKKGATNAETFANTLEAVNQKFGGAAAAQVDTFSGSYAQLNNTFGDLQESIGFIITENTVLQSVFKEVGKILTELQDVIKANKDEISVGFSSAVIAVIKTIRGLIAAVQTAIVVWLELKKAALTAATGLAFVSDSLGITKGKADEFAQAVIDANKAIEEIGEEGGLVKLDEALQRIQNSAEDAKQKQVELLEAEKTIQDERDALLERKLANDEALKQSRESLTEAEQKLIDTVIEGSKTAIEKEEEKLTALLNATATTKAERKKLGQAIEKQAVKITTLEKKEEQKRTAFQKQQQTARLNAASTAFGNLATLSQSKNKELAAIGKASAIAQTTIQTYQSAQAAFSALAGIPFVGPVLGAAAAAAAIVAGLARVAQIRGTPLQEGITSVPGIGTADNFPATLAPQERVVTAEQNQDLTEFLAENQGQNAILIDIRDRLDTLENRVTVNVGGTEIADELLDLQRSGRAIGAA